jgi:DNA-binding transcriptional regulator YdaS (Cro superfamily)
MSLTEHLRRNEIRPSDFAKLIGRHPATVYRWLDGSTRPRWDEIEKIDNLTNGQVTASDWAAGHVAAAS